MQAPATTATAAAEERRLFYVACSRARERLVVTAVASGSDEGDQPSRFVAELAQHRGGGSRPSSIGRRGCFRCAAQWPNCAGSARTRTTQPCATALRGCLHGWLSTQPDGRPIPTAGGGWLDRTTNDVPVRAVDEPLRLSGSQLSGLTECPLRWFLGHEAKGDRGTSAAQGFGSIVHALAADAFRRGVDPDPEAMAEHLDDVWASLGYPVWIGEREQAAAREALERYAVWHLANPRELVAVEHKFEVTVDVDGRDVVLSGAMDRVEASESGVHVVDLKTSKNPPKTVDDNAQLGAYQLAVDAGAAAALVDGGAAGAELVQLRNDASAGSGTPKVQAQAGPTPEEPFFAVEQLRRAVHHIAEESFPAIENENCRYCDFLAVCPTTDAGASILAGEGRS